MKVATLFSGIGAPEWALKRLGYSFQVVLACDNGDVDISSMIDVKREREHINSFKTFSDEKEYVDALYSKYSRKTNFVKKSYLANYPDFNEENYFLDVTLLNGKPLKGKVDLLVGGSPCQSFSTVGFQKGLDDARGNLFFEYLRLVDEIQPKVFIYENVTGIYSRKNKENWDKMWPMMARPGYRVWSASLNAKDFGLPQIRNRFFVVGVKDNSFDPSSFCPATKPLKWTMKDFLVESTRDGEFLFGHNGEIKLSGNPGVVDESYYLSPAVLRYVLTPGTKNWKTHIETDRTIARTLLSTMGNHHRAGVDNYVTSNGRLRSLSERECLRLMGFTDDFKIVVSKPQMYKQAGNSMAVDVVMAILAELRRHKII